MLDARQEAKKFSLHIFLVYLRDQILTYLGQTQGTYPINTTDTTNELLVGNKTGLFKITKVEKQWLTIFLYKKKESDFKLQIS